VVVLDGQEIGFARFEPPACSASLAPWTMSIQVILSNLIERGRIICI
jgi:hypothetical protein